MGHTKGLNKVPDQRSGQNIVLVKTQPKVGQGQKQARKRVGNKWGKDGSGTLYFSLKSENQKQAFGMTILYTSHQREDVRQRTRDLTWGYKW